MSAHAEKFGEVTIWHDDGDEDGFARGWVVSVLVPQIGADLETVVGQTEQDLDGRWATPGKALDRSIEWAAQRGLEVEWFAHRFNVIRPGVAEPARGGE